MWGGLPPAFSSFLREGGNRKLLQPQLISALEKQVQSTALLTWLEATAAHREQNQNAEGTTDTGGSVSLPYLLLDTWMGSENLTWICVPWVQKPKLCLMHSPWTD